MTLPLPRLDTLRYDPLVAEARDLLPYLAPEWTDHNAHDPGITLLELFAWLTEANSYRLDQIPAASERAFLRLLGFEVRPAQVARTVVAFEADSAAGAVSLPAGVQVATSDGNTRFQLTSPFQVVSARVALLLTGTQTAWIEHDNAGVGFQPFGSEPAVGDAFYIGFDRALSPAYGRVRLFAVGDDLAGDERTWRALHAEYRRVRRDVRRACRTNQPCLPTLWEHYGVRVAWEYFEGSLWQPLPGLRDVTRAFSLSGPVRFRAPAAMNPGGVPGHANRWFIRCRLVSGAFDCAPRLTAILVNAVPARHAADNPTRQLDPPSNGQALQRFELSDEPIVPGSTRVAWALPDRTQQIWEERPDFDRSGPLARHYVVDRERGQVVFGDGRSGRVPAAKASLSVRWQTGGGAAGSVAPESLVTLAAAGVGPSLPDWPAIRSALTVSQRFAAWGGADAETLGAAKARAVRSIAEARCLVTLRDFEQAALRAPGAPVARAHAVAEFHPRLAHLPAAGCVTLVIISPCVHQRPDPTPALCRAVRRHLDGRRPVATEVQVTGPDWTEVSVKAGLRIRGVADAAALRAEARRRIDAFFDPLTGGPEGGGWPFGRAVYRSEVLALLDALLGVVAVERLALVRGGATEDLCGNIALCPHGLVRSGTHEFTVAPEIAR